jgi:hypothetical protein
MGTDVPLPMVTTCGRERGAKKSMLPSSLVMWEVARVHDPAALLVEVVEGGDQTGVVTDVVPCW